MRLPISMRFLACLVAATAVLGAQRTWIVDAQMRPGADFPELRLATLVAADGDRILVLPGRYASCSIVRKGLTIVGLPGAEVRSGISGEPAFWAVEVQATQKVSVRGFRIEPQPGGNVAGVFVEGCRGPVHLESLSIGPMEVGLTITRSVAVSVLDVDVVGGVANTIHDSDATLTRCRFVDHAGASGGLAVHSGKASLVDCTVRGYDAIPTLNPASALYCIRSVVTVSGGTYTAGTGSGSRAVPTAAISLSAAELVLDPATACARATADRTSTTRAASCTGGRSRDWCPTPPTTWPACAPCCTRSPATSRSRWRAHRPRRPRRPSACSGSTPRPSWWSTAARSAAADGGRSRCPGAGRWAHRSSCRPCGSTRRAQRASRRA